MADEILGSFAADAINLSPDVPGSFCVDAVLFAAVPGSFGVSSGIGPWGSFTTDAVRFRTYTVSTRRAYAVLSTSFTFEPGFTLDYEWEHGFTVDAVILGPITFDQLATLPTYVSSASAGDWQGISPRVVTKPAGVVAGDIIIANAVVDGEPGEPGVVGWPEGWVEIGNVAWAGGTSNAARFVVAKRVVTASEPSSYSVTVSPLRGMTVTMAAFRGATTVEGIAYNQDLAIQTTSTPSLVTGLAMVVATFGSNVYGPGTWSTPAGMTEAVDPSNYYVQNAIDYMAFQGGTAGPFESTPSYWETNAPSIGWIMALRSSATPGITANAVLIPCGFQVSAVILKTIDRAGAVPGVALAPNSSTNAVDWFPSLQVGTTISVGPTLSTTLLSDAFSPVYASNGQYRVWYKLVIPSGGSLSAQFDTIGSNFDTVLTIYRDTLDAVYSGDDDAGGGAGTSLWAGTLDGGHTWYVLSCSYSANVGNLYVRVTPTAITGQFTQIALDAVIAPERSFIDAVIIGERTASRTINAVRKQPNSTFSFSLDHQWTPGGSFAIEAVVQTTITGQTSWPSYWSDNFNRTLTLGSGWGGTWTGWPYTTYAGVNGSQGFVGPSASAYAYANSTALDAAMAGVSTWDATVEFLTPPVGGSTSWLFQWQIPSTYFYLYPYVAIASPTSAYFIRLYAKGLSTTTSTFQMAPATWYRARIQQGAGTSYLRIWKLTDPEPETWLLTRTQSTTSYSSYLQVNNYTTGSTALFDNMAVWAYGNWGTQDGIKVDAVITYRRLFADAALFKTQLKTLTVNAVKKQPNNLGSFTVDYRWGPGSAFTLNAIDLATISTFTYGSLVQADHPYLWWRFGETTGTIAADSADSRPMTYANTPTLGVAGPADVDGTAITLAYAQTEYAYFGGSVFDLPQGNADRTIEVWMRSAGGSGASPVMFGYGYPSTRQSFVFLLNYASANLALSTYNDDHGVNLLPPNSLFNDIWHHLAVTYTGSTRTAVFYFDGVAQGSYVFATDLATSSYGGTSYAGTAGVLYYSRTSATYRFNGSLKDLALYAYALDENAIADHFLKRSISFRASAVLFPMRFPVDAFLIGTVYGSFAANAVIKAPSGTKTFTFETWWEPGGTIVLDAIRLKTQTGFGQLVFPGYQSAVAGFDNGGNSNVLGGPYDIGAGNTISIYISAISGGNIGVFSRSAPVPGSGNSNNWDGGGTGWHYFTAVYRYVWVYSWDWNAAKTGAGYVVPGGGLVADAVKRKTTSGSFGVDYEWMLRLYGSFSLSAVLFATVEGGAVAGRILASGPAAYWPLSDPTTTSATELVAGRDATVQTPANVTPSAESPIGAGWSWSAQSYLTTTFYQPPTSEASVEAWFKTTSNGEIWQGRYGTSGSGGRGISLSLEGNTGGDFGGTDGHLQFFVNSDGILVGVTTVAAYNDNVLHHVVGVWTSTPGVALVPSQFKVYVDGLEVATTAMDNGSRPTAPLAGNTTAGRFLGYAYTAWTGFAAHIAFYTRSLTTDEVTAHYQRHGMTLWAVKAGVIPIDAVIFPRHFRVDAQLGIWFPADAVIAPRHFPTDALLLVPRAGSFTVAATRFKTLEKTFAANAVLRTTRVFEPGFTLEAEKSGRILVSATLVRTLYGAFVARAIRWQRFETTFPDGVSYQWGPGGWFGIDAFVHMYFRIDARLDLGFSVDAVILSHIGPTLRALSFPGTSQTILGQTANALSSQFPIAPGEAASVILTQPLSDSGDLGFFNPTSNVGQTVPATVGEHDLEVLPGSYYVYSSRLNVYRPGLTGAGSYLDYGTSSKAFTVEAFVQPTFRVSAEIVWHFEFTFPAAAWKMDRVVRSFPASSWVQPWFWVDAVVVPRHFHLNAWIKCEFIVRAWLIRRVTGTLTVSAFVRPVFRVNAVKRKTMAGTFTVGAFKTAPVFGYINVSSQIGWYIRVQASIKLTKYRKFTVAAVVKARLAASSTADAFVQPWFTLDAWIFRREFFVSAVIFGEQTGSKLVDAAFVWHWVVETTADAFVQPYFWVSAVRHEHFEKTIPVSSWSIIRIFGSFTLQAGITGFQTNAVIFRRGMGGVFTFYAWKDVIHTQRTFSVNAEKSDPGAYWDPETETWLHLHLHADAAIVTRPIRPMTVDASFAVDGLGLFSFSANARIHAPEVVTGFWIEAFIDAQKTVVYEAGGKTEPVLTTVTERFTLPGWSDVIGGGENRITSLFMVAPNTQVVLTVWDWGTTLSTGLISAHENLWGNNTGDHSAFGLVENLTANGATTIKMWPEYTSEEHHVYSWNGSNAYDPARSEEGMVSYQRLDTLTLARPAPTIDAWIVGTEGDPWTVDAEIVDREKLRSFLVSSEMSGSNEKRGWFPVESHVLGSTQLWWRMDAALVDHGFSIDALIRHPNLAVDAFVAPYFTVNAVVWKSVIPVVPSTGKGPLIDAVIVRPIRVASFAANADISNGEPRGQARLDAMVLAQRGWRIYLAAQIAGPVAGMTIDAYIAQRVTINAWIQPYFTLNAHVRGDSYIIFPEDGGDPTDAHGNPPQVGRSFRVKIEAFIPDEIPIGNDAEIERLIWLILEAEMELEAMYCAYVHYTPQGAPTVGNGPNTSGTGRTSTLPDAISQIGYPGAGDIDDCWVVATVWAANAAGYSYRPTVPVFRRYAQNPDRPGATGGTLDHVMRGARGCYPSAHIRRYRSTSWDGFISLLKAGWTASLAVRSSGLPASYRYGFNGGHQVGVAYQNGSYYIMNPLQHNGSRPREISGADLRRAARGFIGGTICAAMFS